MPSIGRKRPKLKVFVSYPANDGSIVAKQAASILKLCGHIPYVFEVHKTLGALLYEEIAARVEHSEVFLYICTISSLHSWGQRMEAEYALGNPKLTRLVIPINGAQVPKKLKPFIHGGPLRSDTFQEQFEPIAKKLPKIVREIQTLEKENYKATFS